MKFVEQHERAWGTEGYKGRPTLVQLMEAKVVAFWHPTSDAMNHTATIHKTIEEIDLYVTQLVWHSSKERLPLLRLEAVFVEKVQMQIKTVKIIYEKILPSGGAGQ
ncbi:MAG: hypothetical protein H0X30_20120 [Anaerolineae bacterium]|nr:hypothetical protein [Anaerolineae bacterium]